MNMASPKPSGRTQGTALRPWMCSLLHGTISTMNCSRRCFWTGSRGTQWTVTISRNGCSTSYPLHWAAPDTLHVLVDRVPCCMLHQIRCFQDEDLRAERQQGNSLQTCRENGYWLPGTLLLLIMVLSACSSMRSFMQVLPRRGHASGEAACKGN